MTEIEINGRVYRVRYAYERADGSRWYVLDVSDPILQGEFGDEWPVSPDFEAS